MKVKFAQNELDLLVYFYISTKLQLIFFLLHLRFLRYFDFKIVHF